METMKLIGEIGVVVLIVAAVVLVGIAVLPGAWRELVALFP